jgi:hypothetical protein
MRLSLALGLVAVASIGIAGLSASTVAADTTPAGTMTIAMHGLNGSGQDGTATLTAVGDKVTVSVHVIGEPSDASEPAHVHFGHCPIIKAIPAYNVGPVVGGKATSVVDLTWSEITSGKYVVNVHESTAMLGKYVSCGDIGTSTTPMALPSDGSSGY